MTKPKQDWTESWIGLVIGLILGLLFYGFLIGIFELSLHVFVAVLKFPAFIFGEPDWFWTGFAFFFGLIVFRFFFAGDFP